MSLIDDFKTRFHQFETLAINTAWPGIEPAYQCYYGAEYAGDGGCDDEIILNLCAHLFVMQNSGNSSPIQIAESKSVGSVSVSYGASVVSTESRAFFMSSKYGQMFLQMSGARGCGGAFV